MKTALVSACFLAGTRAAHMRKWLAWYSQPRLQELLGWSEIVLVENGGEPTFQSDTIRHINLAHLRSGNHGLFEYPSIWRTTYFIPKLLQDYDKLIWMDADAFILSERMARYIGGLDQGWTTFWCDKWQCPESAISVLVRGGLPEHWFNVPWEERLGKQYELEVPYSCVEKGFVGDRYGEWGAPQTPDMDYYCQLFNTQPEVPLVFGGPPCAE